MIHAIHRIFQRKVFSRGLQLILSVFHRETYLPVETLWSSAFRIIEFGSDNPIIARFFLDNGFSRYLRISDEDNIYKDCSLNNANEDGHSIRYQYSAQVFRNNANVMIFANRFNKLLRKFWMYRHVDYIVSSLSGDKYCFYGVFASIIEILKGKIQLKRVLSFRCCNGRKHYLLVFKVIHKESRRDARKYLTPLISIEQFYKRLNNANIRYVVLRWFEDLPIIEDGEDMDILCHDEDIHIFQDILNEQPGLVPIDLYSISGLPGTDYNNMAYYPPYLSERILKNRIKYKEVFYVPRPDDYFHSLSYHAIYHKGPSSGIPTLISDVGVDNRPDHDYKRILASLILKFNLHIDVTIDSIHEHLTKKNWNPPFDVLERLSLKNDWINHSLKKTKETKTDITGLTVFLIREKAISLNLENEIVAMLEEWGFKIIICERLSIDKKEFLKSNTRGGNWGKGPYPISGGLPAMAIVAWDYFPLSVDCEVTKKTYPFLTNKKILDVKNRIREFVNNKFSEEEQHNSVHSTDNPQMALEYLQLVFDKGAKDIVAIAKELAITNITNFPVIIELKGNHKRAKVELIKYNGGKAILKTFHPDAMEFFHNELHILEKFSGILKEIPLMFEKGDNWFVCEYIEDTLLFDERNKQLIPLNVCRKVIKFIRHIFDEGYYILDFHPRNIMMDKNNDLKVIDFEFCYRYSTKPLHLEESYELNGLPENYPNPNKAIDEYVYSPYKKEWYPHVGLKLIELINDSLVIQYFKRSLFLITRRF